MCASWGTLSLWGHFVPIENDTELVTFLTGLHTYTRMSPIKMDVGVGRGGVCVLCVCWSGCVSYISIWTCIRSIKSLWGHIYFVGTKPKSP